jgi:hypothetical protein
MRLLSQIVRTSVKSGSILVLMMLVGVSSAEASHRRHAAPARRLCDPQTTTLKQFKRTPHSFGGPVALPSQRLLVGLTDPTTRVTRATEADDDDDDASAIQNDAPAARFDLETRGAPVLVPLGVLARPGTASLRSGAYSPKSPRGPPIAI